MTAPLPAAVRTLGALFDHAAERHPVRNVRTFFAEECLSYYQLAQGGRAVTCGLRAAGVEPGMPVAVLVRSKLDLLRAIHGITAIGAVFVPLLVAVGFSKASIARLRHLIADSGVRVAVVDENYAELFAELLPHVRTLSLSALTDGESGNGQAAVDWPTVDEEDLALIQYTSGSTASPKGVALTHRNVLAGIRSLHHGVAPREGDVLCHWLPLSHDMGLFSTLAAVGVGVDLLISPQQDFVKHPDEWLRRAVELDATILVGPNFFYRYLIDAIPREETAGYDLSKVRSLLNGAEPIDPDLITELARHFAASGLAPQAMKPCYGLAEATLAVTITPADRQATVDWVDRAAMNAESRALPVSPGAAGARGIVGCGVPLPGIEVRITEGARALPERFIGDIEVRGESVMQGYYRETHPTVSPDGWCPTGDLGYLAAGCLHVTGRRKEMMILGGQNYYPQDVEDAIRRVPGVHRGNAVAFVLPPDPAAGAPERIGVLAEVSAAAAPLGAIVSAIRQAAASQLGGASVDVVLLRRNALLRTTSGKFQRLLMRRRLLEGALDRVLLRVGPGEPVQLDEPVAELVE